MNIIPIRKYLNLTNIIPIHKYFHCNSTTRTEPYSLSDSRMGKTSSVGPCLSRCRGDCAKSDRYRRYGHNCGKWRYESLGDRERVARLSLTAVLAHTITKVEEGLGR